MVILPIVVTLSLIGDIVTGNRYVWIGYTTNWDKWDERIDTRIVTLPNVCKSYNHLYVESISGNSSLFWNTPWFVLVGMASAVAKVAIHAYVLAARSILMYCSTVLEIHHLESIFLAHVYVATYLKIISTKIMGYMDWFQFDCHKRILCRNAQFRT